MGSLSVSTHRGLVLWQGLLLVVSLLLTSCCPPTTALFAIVPTNVVEGEDALLHLQDVPPDVTCFRWYKGVGERFQQLIATHYVPKPVYARDPFHNTLARVIHKEFLVLKDVRVLDEGMYTVVAHLPNSKKKVGFGRLTVFVREDMIQIGEKSERVKQCMRRLMANCVSNCQLRRKMKLFQNHRNVTIDPIRKEDAGVDQCQVSDLSFPLKVRPLETDVKYE